MKKFSEKQKIALALATQRLINKNPQVLKTPALSETQWKDVLEKVKLLKSYGVEEINNFVSDEDLKPDEPTKKDDYFTFWQKQNEIENQESTSALDELVKKEGL